MLVRQRYVWAARGWESVRSEDPAYFRSAGGRHGRVLVESTLRGKEVGSMLYQDGNDTLVAGYGAHERAGVHSGQLSGLSPRNMLPASVRDRRA